MLKRTAAAFWFAVIAAVAFAVEVALLRGWLHGSDPDTWNAGGLFAIALSLVAQLWPSHA